MKSLWNLAAVMSAAALVSACGGGGGGGTPSNVAASDATVAISAATGPSAVQAVAGQPIVFPNGVPDFGTTAPTTVNITSAAAPTFTIASGGFTATGDLTFGSCIFTIKTSNYPAVLLVGTKITVTPCSATLATKGVPANGSSISVNATFTLNSVTSSPYKLSVPVAIDPVGNVTVGGVTLVTVKVVPATGATGV